ncbi:nucleotidyltransferase family protein [Alkalimonas mucilaginosa]|uniref:Nucleotidyltransferase family protein n=1 Tax=Alkalimonas mucilaginosa TaxID=3057676 RepID=A0ABU7JBF8_9GAMM|nr:nucleotidyltransferase family protein [Alkalimonas sp. MEB004]MEE2023027.1 nucleotidyltransferase family protein [Alkalimonas sp. MEB004]
MSYNWKNILIQPSATLRDALSIIDSEALRIALVTDASFNLVGVVTDGDIRRGLLKNLSLSDSVELVMNRKPLTIPSNTPRKEAIQLMQAKGLLAIPVLDGHQIIGLETLQQFGGQSRYQNPVFLMAGGFGTRLRPLTDNCPKPLLKVGNKPILEIVLNSFIKAGFVNFYISTHYMPEMIREYFGDGSKWQVNITYVHEETPLGTGGALGLLPSDLADLPLILMNGDVLTNVDFERVLAFHNKNAASATMCVRDYEYQVPFGVINGEGNRIVSMVEKPIQRYFVNAGIYVISPELRKSVQQNQRLDMPTLLEQAIERNREVLMFPIHEYWLDIGRKEDFERAQIDIATIEF